MYGAPTLNIITAEVNNRLQNHQRQPQRPVMTEPDTGLLKRFDITVKARISDFTKKREEAQMEEIKMYMRRHCGKWCFQLEEGSKTGYVHYQCKIILITKKRKSTLVGELLKEKGFSEGFFVTPSSTNSRGDMFYVMKEDTRVEGPWSDGNDKWVDPEKIPQYYKDIPKGGWKPWQIDFMKIIETPMEEDDVGLIWVLINRGGSVGKTRLCNWLEVRDKIVAITPGSDVKDIPRQVMDRKKVGAYIIDMPREMSKKTSSNFWCGIEMTVNGKCADDRYEYEHEVFNPPRVIVFTNWKIEEKTMTGNRWIFMAVNKDYELVTCETQEDAWNIPQPESLGRDPSKTIARLGLKVYKPRVEKQEEFNQAMVKQYGNPITNQPQSLAEFTPTIQQIPRVGLEGVRLNFVG